MSIRFATLVETATALVCLIVAACLVSSLMPSAFGFFLR